MKHLIKKTSRRIVSNRDYGGVCHNCNSPIAYDGEIVAIEIANENDYWLVIPIDVYECPYCNNIIETMRIYKSLEVSKELSKT